MGYTGSVHAVFMKVFSGVFGVGSGRKGSGIGDLGGGVKIFSKKELDLGVDMGTMGGLFQLRRGLFRKVARMGLKNPETKKKLKKQLDIEKVFVLNGRLFHFKKGVCLQEWVSWEGGEKFFEIY